MIGYFRIMLAKDCPQTSCRHGSVRQRWPLPAFHAGFPESAGIRTFKFMIVHISQMEEAAAF